MPSKPMTSTGIEGGASSMRSPLSLNMARTLPGKMPATKESPMCRVPRWAMTVATMPRPWSMRDSMTLPSALPRVVSGELEDLGLEEDGVEELGDALLLERGDLAEDRRAAPFLGLKAELGELGLDPVDVGLGEVDLVDRDDDRDLGGLRVVDGLAGLGHDAVVRRDDEDDDIGDVGAAGAHLREGRVAGRIEEGDPALGRLDLIGADMLRYPAELARDDVGLADRVEKLGLSVVDVAHDRDDRGAMNQVLGLVRRPSR